MACYTDSMITNKTIAKIQRNRYDTSMWVMTIESELISFVKYMSGSNLSEIQNQINWYIDEYNIPIIDIWMEHEDAPSHNTTADWIYIKLAYD